MKNKMPWIKIQRSILFDDKLRYLSSLHGSDAFMFWFALLVSSDKGVLRGDKKFFCFGANIPFEKYEEIKNDFLNMEMIEENDDEDIYIKNWNDYQYAESYERVVKSRSEKSNETKNKKSSNGNETKTKLSVTDSNADVTVMKRVVTIEQEEEKEQEIKENNNNKTNIDINNIRPEEKNVVVVFSKSDEDQIVNHLIDSWGNGNSDNNLDPSLSQDGIAIQKDTVPDKTECIPKDTRFNWVYEDEGSNNKISESNNKNTQAGNRFPASCNADVTAENKTQGQTQNVQGVSENKNPNQNEPPTKTSLLTELIGYGIQKDTACGITDQYEPDYIRSHIAGCRRMQTLGKVKNFPAALITAIQRNYSYPEELREAPQTLTYEPECRKVMLLYESILNRQPGSFEELYPLFQKCKRRKSEEEVWINLFEFLQEKRSKRDLKEILDAEFLERCEKAIYRNVSDNLMEWLQPQEETVLAV